MLIHKEIIYSLYLTKKNFSGFINVRKGHFMELNNISATNFRASVSPHVKTQLYRQLPHTARQKTLKALEKQLENIKYWGSKDSEIVLAKDIRGVYRLGLRYNVTPEMHFTCAIKGPAGKSELTQFLALKEKHILNTEATIKYLYSKYGKGIFNLLK